MTQELSSTFAPTVTVLPIGHDGSESGGCADEENRAKDVPHNGQKGEGKGGPVNETTETRSQINCPHQKRVEGSAAQRGALVMKDCPERPSRDRGARKAANTIGRCIPA